MVKLVVNALLVVKNEILRKIRRKESMGCHWSIIVIISMLHDISIKVKRLIYSLVNVRIQILAVVDKTCSSFVVMRRNKIPLDIRSKRKGIYILARRYNRTINVIDIHDLVVVRVDDILNQMIGSEVIIPIRLAVIHLVQKIRIIVVVVNRPIEVMIIDGNIVKIAVAIIIVVLMGVGNS